MQAVKEKAKKEKEKQDEDTDITANVYLRFYWDWLEWADEAKQLLTNPETHWQDLPKIKEEVTWAHYCANLALQAYHYLLDNTLEGLD